VRGRERGEAKTCFSAGRAVYVHYFKDIRQGALQSDRVMLFGRARVLQRVLRVNINNSRLGADVHSWH